MLEVTRFSTVVGHSGRARQNNVPTSNWSNGQLSTAEYAARECEVARGRCGLHDEHDGTPA